MLPMNLNEFIPYPEVNGTEQNSTKMDIDGNDENDDNHCESVMNDANY